MSKFVISNLVVPLLSALDTVRLCDAVNAQQGRRTVTESASLGTRNQAKKGVALSGEVTKYQEESNVVTAFVQWAESGCGAVDKLAARAGKLGAVVTVSAIPEEYAGQSVRAWVSKFRKASPAPAGGAPETTGKGKAGKGAPVTA